MIINKKYLTMGPSVSTVSFKIILFNFKQQMCSIIFYLTTILFTVSPYILNANISNFFQSSTSTGLRNEQSIFGMVTSFLSNRLGSY